MNFSYVMRGMAQLAAQRRHKTMPPMPAGLYAPPSVYTLVSSTAWLWRRRRRRAH